MADKWGLISREQHPITDIGGTFYGGNKTDILVKKKYTKATAIEP